MSGVPKRITATVTSHDSDLMHCAQVCAAVAPLGCAAAASNGVRKVALSNILNTICTTFRTVVGDHGGAGR
jgi:hypothetical protein